MKSSPFTFVLRANTRGIIQHHGWGCCPHSSVDTTGWLWVRELISVKAFLENQPAVWNVQERVLGIVLSLNCVLRIFHTSKIYNKCLPAKAAWLPSQALKINGEGSVAGVLTPEMRGRMASLCASTVSDMPPFKPRDLKEIDLKELSWYSLGSRPRNKEGSDPCFSGR